MSPGRLARRCRTVVAAALLGPGAAVLLGPGAAAAQNGHLGAAASAFWQASDPTRRSEAAARLLEADVPPDVWLAALRAPPRFDPDPAVGRLDRSRVAPDGVRYPYTVLIPEGYAPSRSYPVLVYLHGGVNRPLPGTPGGWWRDYDRISDPDRIVIVPAAWSEAAWWDDVQIDNVRAILDDVSRVYHVDRDRVHLLGISDGGTGAYYQAFRAATPWASFLPFIAHPAVLSSPALGVDGQMYVTNLRNRPLMIVNGGRDRLYPTASVEPFVRLFREHGVPLAFRPQPEAGHDMSWLPDEAARIDSFIVATERDPLPDALEWETENPDRGRFSWLVIERLGDVPGESDLPDRNQLRVPTEPRPYLAFPRHRPSGRVSVARRSNEVEVRTDGVRQLRLLISPEEFDLARPIRVTVNGTLRFDDRVSPNLATALQWAERDLDRGMIFVAEILVEP